VTIYELRNIFILIKLNLSPLTEQAADIPLYSSTALVYLGSTTCAPCRIAQWLTRIHQIATHTPTDSSGPIRTDEDDNRPTRRLGALHTAKIELIELLESRGVFVVGETG